MMTSILISFILPTIVMLIATILSKKLIYDSGKSSQFGCSFDPKTSSQMPFWIWFLLIAVTFLISDVEIALILPIITIMKTSNSTVWTISTMFFICILLGGLFHEWNQGAMNSAD